MTDTIYRDEHSPDFINLFAEGMELSEACLVKLLYLKRLKSLLSFDDGIDEL